MNGPGEGRLLNRVWLLLLAVVGLPQVYAVAAVNVRDSMGDWLPLRGMLVRSVGRPFDSEESCSPSCRSLGRCVETILSRWECVRGCESDIGCPPGYYCGCLDRANCSGPVTFGYGTQHLFRVCRLPIGSGGSSHVLAVKHGESRSMAVFDGPAYSTDDYYLQMYVIVPKVSVEGMVLEVSVGRDLSSVYPFAYWRSEERLVLCMDPEWSVSYFNPHPVVEIEFACECRQG